MINFIFFPALMSLVTCLDNGLGKTPPMGWLHWERFRCNTDCENDPENCIGEKLYMTMADIIVAEGYKDAGYEYVNIDDCWPARERDANHRLQSDPERFPHGIKALADYIHSKGLKFGIYEDFGKKTCDGFPGSEYYLQLDAETFAQWEVDYLKFDTCFSEPQGYADELPPMAFFLNKTGRSIYLSCEYPLYLDYAKIKPDYKKVAAACNLARNFDDIQDSWDSLAGIINHFGADEGNFSAQAGPGYFNDPDMLIIGDFGLSYDQERVQMGMWAIMASPLLMSVDLRNIRASSKALLQHRGLIAINQDPMGIQGKRVYSAANIQIWTRPILPKGSLAFAIINFNTDGTPRHVNLKLSDIGLKNVAGYNVTEVFDGKYLGALKSSSVLSASVNPTGIYMAKAVPL